MGFFAARTERNVAWTHVLRIVKDDAGMLHDQWSGTLTQIKREINVSSDGLKTSIGQQLKDVNKKVERLTEMLQSVADHSGAKINAVGNEEESIRAQESIDP